MEPRLSLVVDGVVWDSVALDRMVRVTSQLNERMLMCCKLCERCCLKGKAAAAKGDNAAAAHWRAMAQKRQQEALILYDVLLAMRCNPKLPAGW